jgi:hypothetical protein
MFPLCYLFLQNHLFFHLYRLHHHLQKIQQENPLGQQKLKEMDYRFHQLHHYQVHHFRLFERDLHLHRHQLGLVVKELRLFLQDFLVKDLREVNFLNLLHHY